MKKIMGNSVPDSRKILLDGDVISRFIKGNLFSLLSKLYPDRLIILDIVKVEICQRKGWSRIINILIKKHGIQEVSFPNDKEYISEYSSLISTRGQALGKGESACLVYCRFNKKILASSNLKDIHRYCDFHKIDYLTTSDIIFEGYQNGLINETTGDTFIFNVKSKGSKFPYNSIKDLIEAKTKS